MNILNTLNEWLVRQISKLNRRASLEEQKVGGRLWWQREQESYMKLQTKELKEKAYAALVRREARKRARYIRECERGNPCPSPTAPTRSSKRAKILPGSST